MNENDVEALGNFEHGTTRRRGDRFAVSEAHAKALHRAGLVRILSGGTAADPTGAAGEKLSAPPAAPASPQKTVPPRKRGVPLPRAAQSS